jgi:prepilin-type N-terminal cleavage/methylation domain-containing protein
MTIDKKHNTRRRGFTLAEAMMAVVVLSIAAAGVLIPFSSGAAVRAEGMRRTLSAKLASNLIEQIVNEPFHDPDGSSYDYNPGPDEGEISFDQYDNIDDFDGYSESQGQVKDAAGTVFTDPFYNNFSRNVTCEYVYTPQESGTTAPKFILITVQVQYNGKQMASISRLASE